MPAPNPDLVQWPTTWNNFVKSKFYLRSFSQSSISAWTARRNVYGPHAQLWFCELEMVPMEKPSWMPIEALIGELGGQAGLLRIGDVARLQPQRNYESEGTIVGFTDGTFFDDGTGFNSVALPSTIIVTGVDGALKGTTQVQVGGGLPVNSTRVLRRNDLFEARPNGNYDATPQLYMITRDVNTDANGDTLLTFRPALRKGLQFGDTIVLKYPQTVFRLMDDEQGIIERSSPTMGNGSFKLVEAIV